MYKEFAIGDIHGRIDALKEVLQASNFDYDNDKLIVLGDVVDGGINTATVIDELIKIKNLVLILGNHDLWFIDYICNDKIPVEWVNQGGANTLNSYGGEVIPNVMFNIDNVTIPKKHVEFFEKGVYFYEFKNMLFVHGGLNPNKPIKEQEPQFLVGDRHIIDYASNNNIKGYTKVFIGHTSTQIIEKNWINSQCGRCNNEWQIKVKEYKDIKGMPMCSKCKSKDIFQSFGCTKPLKIGNLYCLDTGGGWDGKLTLMNINNDDFWQSKLQHPSLS